jgi:apolipoprotein N-acyltransferase
LGGLNLQHYFGAILHTPLAIQFVIYTVPALAITLAALLFRALLRRDALWAAMLSFPATYTTLEYLLDLGSPHGTAGSLSYSQLNFLPVLQLASLTGPWGITFCLLLFPAALATAIHVRKTSPQRAYRILGVGWGSVALVLLFGIARLSMARPTQTVRVGLIASDAPGNTDVAEDGPATDRLLRDYAEKAKSLAARGVEVIVIPEKVGVVVESDIKRSNELLQDLADTTKAVIVVGLVDVDGSVSHNQARIYQPGRPMQLYDKQHMLPPFESRFKPGVALTMLDEPHRSWGVAICKDMDFARPARDYGNVQAGLMLVPAWDFVADRWSHGHMAVMRGVEDGFSIARAARQGFLTASDDRGRIIAETRSNSAPFATLVADVPSVHHATLYLALGDWFAWYAIVILVLTLAQLFRVQGRSPATEASRDVAA